jgi:hypothetical protein
MEAAMLIGTTEGQGWSYEVLERTEGYLVRMRDLDTGVIEDHESKVFRTAAVAFAFIEMSAAFERYATATMAGEEAGDLLAELKATQALYADISARLGDAGVTAQFLVAWEREAEAADRRRFH